jgi:hypothetical protein
MNLERSIPRDEGWFITDDSVPQRGISLRQKLVARLPNSRNVWRPGKTSPVRNSPRHCENYGNGFRLSGLWSTGLCGERNAPIINPQSRNPLDRFRTDEQLARRLELAFPREPLSLRSGCRFWKRVWQA